MRKMAFFLALLLISAYQQCLQAQARIVFNGAYVNIENGARIVIENNNPNAVTRLAAGGHFISETDSNIVKWNIGSPGATAQTYLIPFGRTSADYIPLRITMENGTGNGYFEFATYGRNDWRNTNYLPPGITNFSGFNDDAFFPDNSRYAVDRFWLIGARGYTTNPDFQNMWFSYIDDEYNQAQNSIQEDRLWVQRYNPDLDTWYDYIPGNGVKVNNLLQKRVEIGGVPDDEIFDWWILVDEISPLPVALLSFTATAINNDKVLLNWETSSEENSDYFLVERSKDAIHWEFVLTQKAAGYSNLPLKYDDIDVKPHTGLSYYRLKMMDSDGSFEYSKIIPVFIESAGSIATMAFPNPTTDLVFLKAVGDLKGDFYLSIFDTQGRLMMSQHINAQDLVGAVPVSLGKYAQGTYFLQVQGKDMPAQAFKLIKM